MKDKPFVWLCKDLYTEKDYVFDSLEAIMVWVLSSYAQDYHTSIYLTWMPGIVFEGKGVKLQTIMTAIERHEYPLDMFHIKWEDHHGYRHNIMVMKKPLRDTSDFEQERS